MTDYKFTFANYTEVTDIALETNPLYKEHNVVKVFICPDVWSTWIARIVKDLNEDYDTEEGSYLLELEKIDNDRKGRHVNMSHSELVKLLENDDVSSTWEVTQDYSIDDLISQLD